MYNIGDKVVYSNACSCSKYDENVCKCSSTVISSLDGIFDKHWRIVEIFDDKIRVKTLLGHYYLFNIHTCKLRKPTIIERIFSKWPST